MLSNQPLNPAFHKLKPILASIRATQRVSTPHWKTLPQLLMSVYLGFNAAGTYAQPAVIQTTIPTSHKSNKATSPLLPAAIDATPSNFQQQVPIDSQITVTFNQAVFPGGGRFIISNGQGDTRAIPAIDGNQITIYGNIIYIKPIKNLLPSHQYTVEMENGTLTDVDNNALPAILRAAALHFTTVPDLPLDKTPPVPLSTTPSDGATQVSVPNDIIVIFNEPIKAGDGNITISNGQGDTRVIAVEDATQVYFSSDNTHGQLTIHPQKALQPATQYYVQADNGAITDLAGNAFAGVQNTTDFNFSTVVDTTPPLLDMQNPLQNPYAGAIALTFNEPVQAGTGEIIIKDALGNQRSIAIHDASQVQVPMPNSKGSSNSSTVVIIPKDGLLAGSEYVVQLASGVVTDRAGNPFAGIQDSSLKITAFAAPPNSPDTTAPKPINSYPTPNQQQVLVSSNFVVNFDEAIQPGPGNFILSDGQGDTRVIASNDASQVSYPMHYFLRGYYLDVTTALINPARDLLANSQYTLQMENTAVTDAAGNPAQAAALTFTTAADGAAPIALSATPANQSQEVAVDAHITAQFNEPIKAGTGTIAIISDDRNDFHYCPTADATQVTFIGNQIDIHPTVHLLPNSHYAVFVDNNAITDITGNPFVGVLDPSAYTFNSVTNNTPPPAPKLMSIATASISPDGLTHLNSQITLTFNKPIKFNSGHLTLSNGQGDTRIIDINDGTQVIYNGNSLAIKPSQNLKPNAHYTLQIDNGAITDESGKAYAGVQDTTTLSFNTAPAAAPTLNHFSLNFNNINYDTSKPHAYRFFPNSPIQMVFNAPIKVNSGNITISNGQGDTRTIAINDSSQVVVNNSPTITHNGSKSSSASNNALTVTLASTLLSNSRYYVQLEVGAITDLSGIPFSGIQDTTTIAFDTGNPQPAAAATNPVQEINQGGKPGAYDANDTLVFNFNVPVTWGNSGYYVYPHSFGGQDVVFSPDGRSASVVLDATSTITLGDTVSFNVQDAEGNRATVGFTL